MESSEAVGRIDQIASFNALRYNLSAAHKAHIDAQHVCINNVKEYSDRVYLILTLRASFLGFCASLFDPALSSDMTTLGHARCRHYNKASVCMV